MEVSEMSYVKTRRPVSRDRIGLPPRLPDAELVREARRRAAAAEWHAEQAEARRFRARLYGWLALLLVAALAVTVVSSWLPWLGRLVAVAIVAGWLAITLGPSLRRALWPR
jgi:hypothetical protein